MDFEMGQSEVTRSGGGDVELMELTMLLPNWQLVALEEAAHRRGLTTGQFLRRFITDLLQHLPEKQTAGCRE